MNGLRPWLLIALMPMGVSAATLDAKIAQEAFVEHVPVSGHPRAGVIRRFEGSQPRPRELWVWLPAERAGLALCVEITSKDGRYLLRLEADPATLPAAVPVLLTYEPQHPEAFAGAGADQFAALATLRRSCDADIEGVIPAAWSIEGREVGLSVYINSGRLNADVIIPREGGPPAKRPCVTIPGGQNIAFDQRCDLEPPALPADAQPGKARLVRYRGPNRAPDLALPIRP